MFMYFSVKIEDSLLMARNMLRFYEDCCFFWKACFWWKSDWHQALSKCEFSYNTERDHLGYL